MLACLGTADHEFAAEEFLIVQFADRALRFLERLHLDEGESFGTLVVTIGYNLCVLHLSDAVEEFEQVALGRIEGEIAYVKTRRRHFDRFGFTSRAFRRGLLLCGWN